MPLASNRYINEYQSESSRINSQRSQNMQLKYGGGGHQPLSSSQRDYNYTDSNTKRDIGGYAHLENIRERTTHEMLNYQLPKDRDTLDNSQLDPFQD